MAAVDGVHLHILRLPMEVDASSVDAVAERASSLLEKVAEADPEAQAILFVEFLAPRDVDRRFPDALYVELGPGSVLTGLVRKIAPSLRTAACGTAAQIDALLAQLPA